MSNSIHTTALSYQTHALEAVQMAGQTWLRGDQLAAPLGFENPGSVSNLFKRNQDEFALDETCVISLMIQGQGREVRVFSLRGAHLLGLLARTPQAKAFRRWVLDVLEGRVRRQPQQAALALPGTYPLATETVRFLDQAVAFLEEAEDGLRAQTLLREFRDGSRRLPDDPILDQFVVRYEAAAAHLADANRAFREIKRDVERFGWTWDGLKAEVRRQRHAG